MNLPLYQVTVAITRKISYFFYRISGVVYFCTACDPSNRPTFGVLLNLFAYFCRLFSVAVRARLLRPVIAGEVLFCSLCFFVTLFTQCTYMTCLCKRTPNTLRLLIGREEQCFKVSFERWERKTIVSEVGRKWVPVWWTGVSKCTPAVCSQFDTTEVQMTAVSWSQVVATRNTEDELLESGQISRSHVL